MTDYRKLSNRSRNNRPKSGRTMPVSDGSNSEVRYKNVSRKKYSKKMLVMAAILRFIRKNKLYVSAGIALILVIVVAASFIKGSDNSDAYAASAISGSEDSICASEEDISATEESAEVVEVTEDTEEAIVEASDEASTETSVEETVSYDIIDTDDTAYIYSEEVISQNAVLIDVDTNQVVAQRNPDEIINPASMTKILTVLVASDYVTDLNDTFTITIDITDYAYVNDCSAVGFLDGETVTVADLLYGTILPSGADAAVGLAEYCAGSQEAFVELMNQKLDELGISDTAHFTNCVGIYDENHYCTVKDMAIILEAAINNDLCREVMSAHKYTTSVTEQHPEGITISNLFLRRIEDKETNGTVVCAKTGFVNQSGNCAASYQESNDGHKYICVTAGSSSSWRCIYDHVDIYTTYTN